MPVAGDTSSVDVKLEAGVEELSRALGFNGMPSTGTQENPSTTMKGNLRPSTKGDLRRDSMSKELIRASDEEKGSKHDLTHTPYDPKCPVCRSAKSQTSPHRRRTPDDATDLPVKKFGDLVTADHVDAGKNGLSLKGDHTAIVIADAFTKKMRIPTSYTTCETRWQHCKILLVRVIPLVCFTRTELQFS